MIVGYVMAYGEDTFDVVTIASNGTTDLETLAPVSNAGEPDIVAGMPYTASVTITGTAALLFHGWNNEAVAEKGAAAKGSAAKKSDNVVSYVYRDEDGFICLPGEYLRMAIVNGARYRQDPRSPRKSAMDMYKAGVVPLTELASLGSKEWDYLDRRRVMVQRNGVTRERPAFKSGWSATVDIQVLLPEYITPGNLLSVLNDAGRLIGVGDFRPTFGRFQVSNFSVQ